MLVSKQPLTGRRLSHGRRHKIFFSDAPLKAAGHERNEQLKRRQERLDEAAERAAEQVDCGNIDLSKLKPEREILYNIDSLSVSNKQKGYVYAWVCEDHPSNAKGLKIQEKLSRPGWEIVRNDMPEARERIEVRTWRKLGDSILMRCPRSIERVNRQAERDRLLLQHASVGGNLEEAAVEAERRGFARVHLNMDHPMVQAAIKRGVSTELAGSKFNRMLREGRIPGYEVGT